MSNTIQEMPSTSEKNAYVVTYKTAKHGANKSEKSFDYGKDMEETPADLKAGSFNGKGDNMQWGEVLWRFSLENVSFIARISMNSLDRKEGTAQILVPPTPVLLPGGNPVTMALLKSFPTYPFSNTGELRASEELARDGELAFIDVSGNNSSVDEKTGEVLAHMKTGGSMIGFMNADGMEFSKFNNLRYLGPSGHLTRPDGMADMEASKKVQEILSSPEAATSAPTESKFVPGGVKPADDDKDKRFAVLEEKNLDKSNKKLKETDELISNIDNHAKSLFGEGKKAASVHNVVMDFFGKKASVLKKKSS